MKQLINIILQVVTIGITASSCQTSAEEIKIGKDGKNYVIILDLSDRLIQRPDQIEIDTVAIRTVFEKFERAVQSNLTVKSKDKFSLRIITQEGSSLPVPFYENSLSIDMSKYTAAEKLSKLNIFRVNFPNHLKTLYQQAILGNRNSSFAGVDIWQYFNEQINSDLDVKYDNIVLILTDGYFDFEDNNHGLSQKYSSTTTSKLLRNMTGFDWQKKADSLEIGLIPVKLLTPAKWQVCGINPKNQDLLESQKLAYLWKKWLNKSGATLINEPIANSSSKKIQGLIQKSI